MTSPTTGDAVVPPEVLLELGVKATRVEGRRVILELGHDDSERVLERLIGGSLTVCRTCEDTRGVRVVLPKSYLEKHDFEEHRDLWIRGRGLAELEAIQERAKRRGNAKALPPGDA